MRYGFYPLSEAACQSIPTDQSPMGALAAVVFPSWSPTVEDDANMMFMMFPFLAFHCHFHWVFSFSQNQWKCSYTYYILYIYIIYIHIYYILYILYIYTTYNTYCLVWRNKSYLHSAPKPLRPSCGSCGAGRLGATIENELFSYWKPLKIAR